MAATSLRALPALESPFDAEDLAMSRSTSALPRPTNDGAPIRKPGMHPRGGKRRPGPSGPKKLKPLVKAEPGHFDPPPDADPPQSLLRYDAPLFVGVDGDDELIGDMGVKERTCAPDLDDMVNAMLPPRQWTQLTGTWCQFVSKTPATRDDLVALSNELDGLLRDRQARPKGICPVRQALFSQTFDELIRQVTLDQPLLGLMLLRIRDQQRMVNDATSWVHLAGVDFGMEKLIAAEPGMEELIVKIAAFEAESSTIVDHIMELYKKADVEEKRAAELRAIQEKINRDEIEALKFQGQHLDGLLRMFGPGGNKPT
ncbi:dynein heavy chain binding protein [Aureococcus anophagefferens]|nr:dynein heavy chain binding protein [Aureococcus anophagefferens]